DLHGECWFVDQIRRMRSDDMCAQHFTGRSVRNDFEHASRFRNRQGFPQPRISKSPDLDPRVVAAPRSDTLARLLLGESYPANFRQGENASRHNIVVHLALLAQTI